MATRNRNDFWSCVVRPINFLREGLELGYYDKVDKAEINEQNIQLQATEGNKRIYVVSFSRKEINSWQYQSDCTGALEALGLRPCEYGPNYLLGLIARLGKNRLPIYPPCKQLVAYKKKDVLSDRPPWRFNTRLWENCSLAVSESYGRTLRLEPVYGDSDWEEDTAILAEETPQLPEEQKRIRSQFHYKELYFSDLPASVAEYAKQLMKTLKPDVPIWIMGRSNIFDRHCGKRLYRLDSEDHLESHFICGQCGRAKMFKIIPPRK
jgi:hypothetical protein